MRLIDADAIDEVMLDLNFNRDFGITRGEYKLIDSVLSEFPTIEERKKGRWIAGQCSICGCDIPAYIIDWKWQKDMDANFCPNCGADMRGERDETN